MVIIETVRAPAWSRPVMTARLTRFSSRNGVSEVQSRRRECRALREALPYETPTPRPAKPGYRMKSDFVREGQAPRLRWRLAMTKPMKMAVPELTMVDGSGTAAVPVPLSR